MIREWDLLNLAKKYWTIVLIYQLAHLISTLIRMGKDASDMDVRVSRFHTFHTFPMSLPSLSRILLQLIFYLPAIPPIFQSGLPSLFS